MIDYGRTGAMIAKVASFPGDPGGIWGFLAGEIEIASQPSLSPSSTIAIYLSTPQLQWLQVFRVTAMLWKLCNWQAGSCWSSSSWV
jgi:hypothetical protein